MRARIVLIILMITALSACGGPDEERPDAPAPKIVGYFAGWGTYGRDFQVDDLVTSGAADRLTHLNYAFGKVDKGRCAVADAWADYQKPISEDSSGLQGNFGRLRQLKQQHPDLRVLWSFGGWTGSAGFTEAARDPAAFADSCHKLLTDQRWSGLFDGIDIDWEYPNACGLQCDKSGPGALPKMIGALRSAFGPDALITAAVPADVSKLRATDYKTVSGTANWLNAMTYDYFGAGGDDARKTPKTAPHSPLTAYPGIPRESSTATATIDELLALGVPSEKVLLGLGFYGRGWDGVTEAEPGGEASGPAPGKYEKGLEDYKVLAERCPPTGTIAGTAYALCGTQWWSYDTPQTIKTKIEYARSKRLGGAFAWELSGDTPKGDLLGAVSSGLAAPPTG